MERRRVRRRNPLLNWALVVLVILLIIYVPLRVRMERSERMKEGPAPRIAISLFFTDRLSGRVEPFERGAAERCGMARWASLIDERRRERPVIVIDTGDFSPAPEAASRDSGDRHFFEAMRYLRYDAVGIGEHETRIGLDGILTNAHARGLPFLSSNIIDRKTGKPAARAGIVKELGGTRTLFGRRGALRVGIFSVALPEYIYASRPDAARRYYVVNPKLAALEAVTNLRAAGCSLIIAISHQGWPRSLELARDVRGIDLVLNGHCSHETTYEKRVGSTVVVDPGVSERSFTEVSIRLAGDSLVATSANVRGAAFKSPEDPRFLRLRDRHDAGARRRGARTF